MHDREAVLAELGRLADELERSNPKQLEELLERLQKLVRFQNPNKKLVKTGLT